MSYIETTFFESKGIAEWVFTTTENHKVGELTHGYVITVAGTIETSKLREGCKYMASFRLKAPEGQEPLKVAILTVYPPPHATELIQELIEPNGEYVDINTPKFLVSGGEMMSFCMFSLTKDHLMKGVIVDSIKIIPAS